MFSAEQYDAATHGAVLLESSRGTIVLTGSDRAAFLHALLTNDIATLAAGSGTYAAYLTPQGRMIADMRVVETGQDMLLAVEREIAGSLAERLDKLIFSEDVQVRNATGELSEVRLHGPDAARVLEKVIGVPAARLKSLKEYDNLRPPASPMTIVRDSTFGVEGFDIYVPAAEAAALTASMIEAGAVKGSAEVAEVLRVENRRPRFGVDMDTDTIPLEAGIEDRAISMTKGCYVGQEVIVRVLHRGHGRVAKRLVGIDVNDIHIPLRGDAILAGSEQIGRVTSAALSPKTGSPLVLGYVQREFIEPGTELQINTAGQTLQATVRELAK